MKTILCYGDSLTWGYNAEGPSRHALADRWPSALQAELGTGVQVIADGLNGRTTAFDDDLAGEDRNGARTLPVAWSWSTCNRLDALIPSGGGSSPQTAHSPPCAASIALYSSGVMPYWARFRRRLSSRRDGSVATRRATFAS